MKKLFMLIGVAGLACASQAASLDWKYTATKNDVGQTVYVMLGAEAVETWDNAAAVEAASLDHGKIAQAGCQYLTAGSFSSDKITKTSASVYYVVVAADGESFAVTSVSDMTGSVYDPAAQETSSGENTSLSSGSITKSGIAWGTGGGDDPGPGPDDPPGPGPDNPPTPGPGGDGDVPEPTSGLLLMIGGAALALRRRR